MRAAWRCRLARRLAGGVAAVVIASMLEPVVYAQATPAPQPPDGALVWSTAATMSGSTITDGTIYYTPLAASPVAITQGEQPRLSPDGKYLAFKRNPRGGIADDSDLWLRTMATGAEQKIINNTNSQIHDYSWDPTTDDLYLDDGCTIQDVKAAAATMTQVGTDTNCGDDGPVLRPGDGLYVQNLDDGLFRLSDRSLVPGTGPGDAELSFVPTADATKVAYLHEPDPDTTDQGNLEVLPLDAGSDVQPDQISSLNVADGDGLTGAPIWSTDGSELLSAGTVNGQSGVWVFSVNDFGYYADRSSLAGPGVAWIDQVVGGFQDTLVARDDPKIQITDDANATELADVLANDTGPLDEASLGLDAAAGTFDTQIQIGSYSVVEVQSDGNGSGFGNLVPGNSFEDTALDEGDATETFTEGDSVSDWTVDGQVVLAANKPGGWAPSEGSQSVALLEPGNTFGDGAVSQDISVAPSVQYRVDFDMAPDPQVCASDQTATADVQWDGNTFATVHVSGNAGQPSALQWTSGSAVAPAGDSATDHQLSFRLNDNSDCPFALDDVRLRQAGTGGNTDVGPDYHLCDNGCVSAHQPVGIVPAATAEPNLAGTVAVGPLNNGTVGTGPLPLGGTARATLSILNHGPAATSAITRAIVALPDGLRATSVSASWNCQGVTGSQLECSYDSVAHPVAANTSYPPLTIDIAVAGSAGNATIDAAVITSGDSDASDNLPTVDYTTAESTTGHQPITVAVRGSPTIAPDTETKVLLDVTNPGSPRGGIGFTVQLPSNGFADFGDIPDPWGCSGNDTGKSECAYDGVAPSGPLPAIPLLLGVNSGPQQACDATDLQGPICTKLHLANGIADTDAVCGPHPCDAITHQSDASLPVSGARETVTAAGDSSVPKHGTASETLTVANSGNAKLTLPGVRLSVLPASDATISIPDSAQDSGWFCSDQSDGHQLSYVCLQDSSVAAGSAAPALPVAVHAGVTSAGAQCGQSDCVQLLVDWSDSSDNPDAPLLVDNIALTSGTPNPPDLATGLSAALPAAPSTKIKSVVAGGLVVVTETVTNKGGPTTSGSQFILSAPDGWTPDGAATATGAAQCSNSSGFVRCLAGSVAAGTSVQISQTYDVPIDTGTVSFTGVARTTNDANTVNNTASFTLQVTAPTQPSLSLDVDATPGVVTAGQDTTMTATVHSAGAAAVTGPITVSMRLPHGNPAGAVLDVRSIQADPSWACHLIALSSQSILACARSAGLAAGADAPPVSVVVGTADSTPSSTVSVAATVQGGNAASASATGSVRLLPGGPPSLSVTTSQPASLATGGNSAKMIATVQNTGGSTVQAGASIRLDPPAGLRLALPATGVPGWTCTQVAQTPPAGTDQLTAKLLPPSLRCALQNPLEAGVTAPPLVLDVTAPVVPSTVAGLTRLGIITRGSITGHAAAAAAETTDPSADGPHTIAVAVNGTGQSGIAVHATTAGVVNRQTTGRPVLTVTQTPTQVVPPAGVAAANFDQVVQNIGTGDAVGELVLTDTVPTGVTATAQGPGWQCAQHETVVTCALAGKDSATLASGAKTAPVHVDLSEPVDTTGDNPPTSEIVEVNTAVSTAGLKETNLTKSVAHDVTAAITPVPRPKIALGLEPSVNPLTRGTSASVLLRLTNTGIAATDPVVVIMSVPDGVSVGRVPYLSPNTNVKPRGPPAWSCYALPFGRVAAPSSVVCQHLSEPGGDLGGGSLRLPISVGGDAANLVNFTLGLASAALLKEGRPDGGSDPFQNRNDPLSDAARALVRLHSIPALNPGATAAIDVTGFVAIAGPDQTVVDQTPAPVATTKAVSPRATPNTVLAPTKVTLDGSKTANAGLPQTFAWRQLTGPAVTWSAPAAGTQPGSGSSLPQFPANSGVPFAFDGKAAPDDWGAQPTFTLPAVRTPATLTFRLYVTDGSQVSTDDVNVTDTPLPDNPPSISTVTADIFGSDRSTTPYPPGTAVAKNTVLFFRPTGTDPDGDPVSYTVTAPGLVFQTEFLPSVGTVFATTWPANLLRALVTITASDGQKTTQRTVLIGPPQPALSVAVTPSPASATPVHAGAAIGLTASATGGDASTANQRTWSWSQEAADTVHATITPAGAQAIVHVPANAPDGTVLHISAVVHQGGGADLETADGSFSVPVTVTPVSISADPPAPIATGASTTIAVAAAGFGALNVTASVPSGDGQIALNAAKTSATYTAPSTAGVYPVTFNVTDAANQTATTTVQIIVGATDTTSSSASDCSSGSPIGAAIAAAKANTPANVTVGPFRLNLSNLTIPGGGDCSGGGSSSSGEVDFSAGSFSLGPITISALAGTITTSALTLTAGTATLPSAWGLSSATVNPNGTSPVVLSFSPLGITGSLSFTGLPFLAAGNNVTTMLSFSDKSFSLSGQAPLLGGQLKFEVDGDSDGNFSIDISTPTPLQPFGSTTPINLTGGGTITDGAISFTATADFVPAGAPGISLLGGLVMITAGTVTVANTGITVSGAATIGTAQHSVNVTLHGSYVDEHDWTLTATAGSSLSVPGAGSASGFTGTIADTGSKIQYDLTATLAGTFTAGPFSTTSGSTLSVELTNHSPDCVPSGGDPTTPYLEVHGNGAFSFLGQTSPQLDLLMCLDPQSGDYSVTSKVGAPNWQPLPDLTVNGLSLDLSGANWGAPSFALSAQLTSHGVTGALDIQAIRDSSNTYQFVFDAAVNIGSLGLPVGSGAIGHLVYATASLPNVHLTVPGADTITTSLEEGFTGLIGSKLSDLSVDSFLHGTLGLPDSAELIFSGNLNGSGLTVKAELQLRQPVTLFTVGSTKVGLTSISLQFSTDGTFSLAAAACLHQTTNNDAESLYHCDGTGGSPDLSLEAAVAIDLPNSTISASLTAYNWNNAFGQTGLNIKTITAQLGFNFATGTPTFGFGATIGSLPSNWRTALGVADSEPMTLVFNISATNPIFALSLGVPDTNIFLKPLTPIGNLIGGMPGKSVTNAIEIDDASLVIAPNGGDVGPYHYDRGFSLQFDGQILGIQADILAKLDLTAGTIDVKAAFGAVNIGPFALHASSLDLHADLHSGFVLAACGGFSAGSSFTGTATIGATIALPGQNPQLPADSACTEPAPLSQSVGPPPGCIQSSGPIALAFDAQLGGIDIAPGVASIDNIHLYADGGLTGLGVIPQICVGVTAQATLPGGLHPFLTGSLTIGALGITGIDVSAGLSQPVTIAGVKISAASGAGIPPQCTQAANTSASGPSVTLAANITSGTFTIGIQGGISTPVGISVDGCGIFSSDFLTIAASASLSQLADLSFSGGIFYGSNSNLISDRAMIPMPDGSQVQAKQGDFYVAAAGDVNLELFKFSGHAFFGTVGGVVYGHLDATFDALGSVFTLNVQGDICLSITGATCPNGLNSIAPVPGTNLRFKITGTGALNADGFSLGASASATVASNGVSVSGRVQVAAVTASFSGSLSTSSSGGLQYTLTATAGISLPVVSASGAVTLTNVNGPAKITGYLTASAGPISFYGYLSVSTDGSFDIGGGVNLSPAASVTASLSNSGLQLAGSLFIFGFSAHISTNPFSVGIDLPGLHNITLPYTNQQVPTYYASAGGCIDISVATLCAGLAYELDVTLDTSGFHISGDGSGWVELQIPGPDIDLDIGLSIDTDPSLEICGTVSVWVWSGTVCLPRDIGL